MGKEPNIESTRARNTKFLVLLDMNMSVMNGFEFLKHFEQKEFQVFHYCEKPQKKKVFSEITSTKNWQPI